MLNISHLCTLLLPWMTWEKQTHMTRTTPHTWTLTSLFFAPCSNPNKYIIWDFYYILHSSILFTQLCTLRMHNPNHAMNWLASNTWVTSISTSTTISCILNFASSYIKDVGERRQLTYISGLKDVGDSLTSHRSSWMGITIIFSCLEWSHILCALSDMKHAINHLWGIELVAFWFNP